MSNLILRTLNKEGINVKLNPPDIEQRGLASNLILYLYIKVVIAQVLWPFNLFIFIIIILFYFNYYFYFLSLKTLFFIRHRRINVKKLIVTVIMVSFQGAWSQDSENVFGIRLALPVKKWRTKIAYKSFMHKTLIISLIFKSNNVMWNIKLKII